MSAHRVLLAALVVLLSLDCLSVAHAANVSSRQLAYEGALAQAASLKTATCNYFGGSVVETRVAGDIPQRRYYAQIKCSSNMSVWRAPYGAGDGGMWVWPVAECPSGTVWDDASKTCFSSAACLAKPNLEKQTYAGNSLTDSLSFEGCEFVPVGDNLGLCLVDQQGPGEDLCISATSWKPSGNPSASSNTPQPMTDGQTCTPAGAGQTMCVKADGRHCYEASTGRQICWRPGETGEKTDGDVLQVRNAGDTPATPQTQPPPADMFVTVGDPQRQVACYGAFRESGCATGNSTSPGIHTTTQNYKTSGGTNAGGSKPDEGENADGTPGPSPGNSGPGGGGGQGEGTTGSASGGTTCDSPPQCSGDPVGCAVLEQQHYARCEAATGRDVSGMDDGLGDGPEDSVGLWDAGDAPELDMAGFLTSRTCPEPPTFTIGGQTRTIDTSGLCDISAVIAALVLLMAAAHCAWVLGEH